VTHSADDVVALVPQAGVARLVESVVELREDGIDCAGCIPLGHSLVRGGSAPAFVGLELAAQAAAVFEALRRRQREGESEGGARVGYLVSLRDVRLERRELPAGVPLVASIRSLGGAASLARYDVRVLHDGAVALQGTLGTFLRSSAGGPHLAGAR